MKTFTANDGTSWNIHITAGSLLRIHTMCGVDLLNNPLDFPTGIAELVGVLWATIQPQAQQAGISAEKFGEGLGGLELATAADIFVDELGFFFTDLKQRPKAILLQMTWEMLKNHQELKATQVQKALGATCTDSQA